MPNVKIKIQGKSIVATDVLLPRISRPFEKIGTYNRRDPQKSSLNDKAALQVAIAGAKPTASIRKLLQTRGILKLKSLYISSNRPPIKSPDIKTKKSSKEDDLHNRKGSKLTGSNRSHKLLTRHNNGGRMIMEKNSLDQSDSEFFKLKYKEMTTPFAPPKYIQGDDLKFNYALKINVDDSVRNGHLVLGSPAKINVALDFDRDLNDDLLKSFRLLFYANKVEVEGNYFKPFEIIDPDLRNGKKMKSLECKFMVVPKVEEESDFNFEIYQDMNLLSQQSLGFKVAPTI